MASKYKWAKQNKAWLKNIISLLHSVYLSNRAPAVTSRATAKGATHKVRASGLGGWTRKMNRAAA